MTQNHQEESDFIDTDLETTRFISSQIDKLASQVVWPNNNESTNSQDAFDDMYSDQQYGVKDTTNRLICPPSDFEEVMLDVTVESYESLDTPE